MSLEKLGREHAPHTVDIIRKEKSYFIRHKPSPGTISLPCLSDLVSFFALAARNLKQKHGSPPATTMKGFMICLL